MQRYEKFNIYTTFLKYLLKQKSKAPNRDQCSFLLHFGRFHDLHLCSYKDTNYFWISTTIGQYWSNTPRATTAVMNTKRMSDA